MAAELEQATHIGLALVQQYYGLFDSIVNREERLKMAGFYQAASQLTWERERFVGPEQIVKKFVSLAFDRIQHVVKSVDCQPSGVHGVIVVVCGEVRIDADENLVRFSHIFHVILNPGGAFWVHNEVFRFNLG